MQEEGIPKFPLTRYPNSGPDQVRLRLLSGTSGLNATMSHAAAGRSARCPNVDCGVDEKEGTLHFLLRCETYADSRRKYLEALRDHCTCRSRLSDAETVPCDQFFASLDDEGKALFMLGGPVDGRTPEPAVDAAARSYVMEAYGAAERPSRQAAEGRLDKTKERSK